MYSTCGADSVQHVLCVRCAARVVFTVCSTGSVHNTYSVQDLMINLFTYIRGEETVKERGGTEIGKEEKGCLTSVRPSPFRPVNGLSYTSCKLNSGWGCS